MDKFPSIEKLAAYFDGNLPEDEIRQIDRMAADNEAIHEILGANSIIDDSMASFYEQDLQLPDEIVGMDFGLPEIGNIDSFSVDGDRFWESWNQYGQEGHEADKEINKESEQNVIQNRMNTLERTIGETEPFPGADIDIIKQQFADTCAIKSQQIILQSFGQDIPEEQLRQEAIDLGIYVPGHGTLPDNAGDLLNNHNVPTHVVHDAHVYDLVNELAQGHKVIVGVDSGELWNPSIFEKIEDWFGGHADHALIVTGIDTTDADDVKVIITDPGSGDVAIKYPMSQFIDAWHDSNCIMIATNDAPPVEFEPLMVNFDYNVGHIDSIGDIPYEIFAMDILPLMDSFFDNSIQMDNSTDVFNHALMAFNAFNADTDLDFEALLTDNDYSSGFESDMEIDMDI